MIGANASVTGSARVDGSAVVDGWARVTGSARVDGSAVVDGWARVTGSARVGGWARVTGSARVDGLALVCSAADVLTGTGDFSWTAFLEIRPDGRLRVVFQYGCERHPLRSWTPARRAEMSERHGASPDADRDRALATVRAYFSRHPAVGMLATEYASRHGVTLPERN